MGDAITEKRVFKIEHLCAMLKKHYDARNCDFEFSWDFTGLQSYSIHERGKPFTRSLTTEQACEEMALVLFPDENLRIVGVGWHSGDVEAGCNDKCYEVFVTVEIGKAIAIEGR